MSLPAKPFDLSRAELEARFVERLGEVTELKQIVAAQRDEIARLKGLKGRLSIKPSGMENSTGPKRGGKRVKRRRRGKVTPRVVPETEVLRVEHPKGSQFKGYEPYQVQDLLLTARVVRYRRERWLTPQGETNENSRTSRVGQHWPWRRQRCSRLSPRSDSPQTQST